MTNTAAPSTSAPQVDPARRLAADQGPRPPGGQALGPGRRRDAVGVRPGPRRVLQPPGRLFAAFGSFALLLLVEFTGRPAPASSSYAGLFVVGGCFIALGTVVSTHKVAAVVAMAWSGSSCSSRASWRPRRRRRDGGVAHLRPAGRGGRSRPRPSGPAWSGGRWPARSASPPACWSGRRRGTTTCGAGCPLPSRRVARLADARAAGRVRSGGAGGRRRPSWRACASSSRGRPTRRRALRRAPWRSPSWWAGSSGSPATRP